MQHNTKPTNFGFSLNLNFSRTSYLNELIFWITEIIQNINYGETLFLFKLLNVEGFWRKNALIDKYDDKQNSFIIKQFATKT